MLKNNGSGSSGEARNFKRREALFPHFFKRILFGRTDLKMIEKEERLLGSDSQPRLSASLLATLIDP